MYDGVGCGGVGWAPLQNVQQTTSTTVFAGGLCNASLQSSHLTARQKKVTAGGGAGFGAPSDHLWLPSAHSSKDQFGCFWHFFGGGFRGGVFGCCEKKMEPKWTKVLVLLVFSQRKFGGTLKSGPVSSFSVGLV